MRIAGDTPRVAFREAALRDLFNPRTRADVLRLPAAWMQTLLALLGSRLASVAGRAFAPRLPFVGQMEIADCGAACLAMVLGGFGRHVPLREVRTLVGCGRGGASALDILRAARRHGLVGRGVRLEPAGLRHLRTGAILHWGFDHFLVFERAVRGGIAALDPAHGRRVVPDDEVGRRFTGVALVFERGETFAPGGRRDRSLRRYAARLMPHWPALAQVLLCSVVLQALVATVPLLTGTIVDRVVPRGEVALLPALAVGAAGLVAFQLVAGVVRSLLLVRVQTLLDSELGLGFVDHLTRLPYGFFLRRSAGDLLARFQSSRGVRETLTTQATAALLDGTLVVFYLAALLWASAPIGVLVLGLGLLHVALFAGARRRLREIAGRSLDVQARAASQLIDIVSGMETLKAMGAEPLAVERWSHAYVDELNAAVEKGRLQAWTDAVRGAIQIAGPLALLLLGAHLVVTGGLTLGTMLALNALAFGFLAPLAQLVSTAFQLQELRGHIARIDDVLQEPVEQDAREVQVPPRLSGEIRLEHVDFAYAAHEAPVLRDVSLSIAPGQKVAIVGPSGAGKSTLARLMIGLYAPSAGRVSYDGRDLAHLDLSALRRQIGVVCQGAHVFGTSVRANIALADPGALPQAVADAARLAEIHDDIAAMPMQYETVLSDGAGTLSGGQRQRLAIARALLQRPAILVLDEATSELDTMTERRIMDRLAELQSTRIVVAHRLSTIVDADLIVVLDRGTIVESGRHEDLLARGGLYARLAAGTGRAREGTSEPFTV